MSNIAKLLVCSASREFSRHSMQALLVSAVAKEVGTSGMRWAAARGGQDATPWSALRYWLRELEKSWCMTDSALQLLLLSLST